MRVYVLQGFEGEDTSVSQKQAQLIAEATRTEDVVVSQDGTILTAPDTVEGVMVDLDGSES
mgnify:CR=1 FL=1